MADDESGKPRSRPADFDAAKVRLTSRLLVSREAVLRFSHVDMRCGLQLLNSLQATLQKLHTRKRSISGKVLLRLDQERFLCHIRTNPQHVTVRVADFHFTRPR